ncbi:MAG: ATP-binding protein, partial [Spirochaetales bacterium]|nr:ATP-binding protein [Spirochaetales bacterium]
MKMDKMASLGAMVAGMAHEVNNPNQGITLDLHYLNETLPEILSLLEKLDDSRDVTIGSPDTEESRGGTDLKDFRENALSALKEMDESTRRIDHIVKELKRLVRGKENSGYSDVDINSTVRTVCDLSRHMIRSSALSFTLELTEKLPPVRGDQIALEQVVLNLLQNACQSLAGKKGGIRISTSLDRDMLLLRIEDEGSGIAPEDIHRITDPFFTTRSGSGGTGLGLSISAGIIRDHRGKISFESELKVGTAVSVRLPLSTFGN